MWAFTTLFPSRRLKSKGYAAHTPLFRHPEFFALNRTFTKKMVLEGGLEPPRITPYGPQPYASANSATRAHVLHQRGSLLLRTQSLNIFICFYFANRNRCFSGKKRKKPPSATFRSPRFHTKIRSGLCGPGYSIPRFPLSIIAFRRAYVGMSRSSFPQNTGAVFSMIPFDTGS